MLFSLLALPANDSNLALHGTTVWFPIAKEKSSCIRGLSYGYSSTVGKSKHFTGSAEESNGERLNEILPPGGIFGKPLKGRKGMGAEVSFGLSWVRF
jgi:hypothetical protein